MGEPAKKIDSAELWLVEVSKGRSFPLRDGFTVGRGEGDVQILDPSVSTKHCVFHLKGKVLEIEDLGSRNGTFVGGQKLEPKMRLALLPGARVEIGNQTFEVRGAEPPEPKGTSLELASLCSQLEPDSIPAPHPSAWSAAALPKGAGRAAASSPAKPNLALAPNEPIPLKREQPAYKATGTYTKPTARTITTVRAQPAAVKGQGRSRWPLVVAVLAIFLVLAAFFVRGPAGGASRASPQAATPSSR